MHLSRLNTTTHIADGPHAISMEGTSATCAQRENIWPDAIPRARGQERDRAQGKGRPRGGRSGRGPAQNTAPAALCGIVQSIHCVNTRGVMALCTAKTKN